MDIFEKSRASELFTSVIALSLLCAIAAPGQVASKTWTQRTPDGQPDLEGYWSNVTITPLERPAELAGKEFYTQQELADQEKKSGGTQKCRGNRRDDRALRFPSVRAGPDAD